MKKPTMKKISIEDLVTAVCEECVKEIRNNHGNRGGNFGTSESSYYFKKNKAARRKMSEKIVDTLLPDGIKTDLIIKAIKK